MRKLIPFLLVLCAFCVVPVVCAQTATPTTAADPKIYGEYPLAYRDITQAWMQTRLIDPASAVFEWLGEPTAGEITPKNAERVVGYIVYFKVSARNQFGGSTGKQKYRVLIRNGLILWGGRAS
jgi:hypothetical protein